jgi:aminoglycoside 3-N-acetyltransferase
MHTRMSLARDLGCLGIQRGTTLLVHSGYRAFGAVEGGPDAVVAALRAALGAEGTVLAPTFTNDLIDPSTWPTPPEPAERARIMGSMPTFSRETSEPHKMGAIARAVWKSAGAQRSDHPVTSWAGAGALAAELLADQSLDDPEGVDGPVGKAWRADARILLAGVDHDCNTTIHLAESLLEMPHLEALPDRYPSDDEAGNRTWRPVRKTTKCSDGFVKLGPALEEDGAVRHGRLGDAIVMVLRSRDVVRVAVDVLSRRPTALLCDDPTCVHCPTSRRVLEGWEPEQSLDLPA